MKWLVAGLFGLAAGQTLNLHAQLTLGKKDDKSFMYDEAVRLSELAKKEKFDPALLRFVDNMVKQLEKVKQADKQLKEEGEKTPDTFTTGKYKLKTMSKLRAKKQTVKEWSTEKLNAALDKGTLEFTEPFVVRNSKELFPTWDDLRRHWTADRIKGDEELEANFKMDYWPPDAARARMVGNQVVMEKPSRVPFSRYLVLCFHGTPANPRIPGQATEHCEQTVGAKNLASPEEIEELRPFKKVTNMFQQLNQFRSDFVAKGNETITSLLGEEEAEKWFQANERYSHQQFVFGPSGSGDKLHAENGLPFYDVLLHGQRRWLILGEEELQRVADKAREALEFQKTSAYMFFEDKLPELKEEFGLKKFVECNQEPGDVMFIPPGWYRVSLSLADSISFYEQMLHEPKILPAMINQNLWMPQFQQFRLGYCFRPEDISTKLGSMGARTDQALQQEFEKIQKDKKGVLSTVLSNLITCGGVTAISDEFNLAKDLTLCNDKIWKACRKRLVLKGDTKKKKRDYSWLPDKSPRSMDMERSTKDDEAKEKAKEEL